MRFKKEFTHQIKLNNKQKEIEITFTPEQWKEIDKSTEKRPYFIYSVLGLSILVYYDKKKELRVMLLPEIVYLKEIKLETVVKKK